MSPLKHLLCLPVSQICNLEEQLEQFREELENKSEEVQQLHMQLEIQNKELSSQQEYLEDRESLLQVNNHAARIFHIFNTECECKRWTCTFTYVLISNFSYCRIKKTTEKLTVFNCSVFAVGILGKLRKQFVPSNSFCIVAI